MQACEVCGWDTSDGARVCATCRAQGAAVHDDATALLNSVLERARGDGAGAGADADDAGAARTAPRARRTSARDQIVLREVTPGDDDGGTARPTPATIAASLVRALEGPQDRTATSGGTAPAATGLPTNTLDESARARRSEPGDGAAPATGDADARTGGYTTGRFANIPTVPLPSVDDDAPDPTTPTDAPPAPAGGGASGDETDTADDYTDASRDEERAAQVAEDWTPAPTDADEATAGGGASGDEHEATDADQVDDADEVDGANDTTMPDPADDATTQAHADETPKPDGSHTGEAEAQPAETRDEVVVVSHEAPADDEAPDGTAAVAAGPPAADRSPGQLADADRGGTAAQPDAAPDEAGAWTAVAQVVLLIVGMLCVFQVVVLLVVNQFLTQTGSDVERILSAHDRVLTVMLPALAGGALAALALAVWRALAAPTPGRRALGLPYPLWAVGGGAVALLAVVLSGTSTTVAAAQTTTLWAIVACTALGAACIVAPRSLADPDEDADVDDAAATPPRQQATGTAAQSAS